MRSESTLLVSYPRTKVTPPTGFGLLASLFLLIVVFATLVFARANVTLPATVSAEAVSAAFSVSPDRARFLPNVNLLSTAPTSETVYFTVAPGLAVSYPYASVLPLSGLTVGLLLVLFLVGLVRRRLILGGVVLSALIYTLVVLLILVAVELVWLGMRTLIPTAPLLLTGLDQRELYMGGFSALTVALSTGMYVRLMWPERVANLFAGALLAMTLLLGLLTVAMPGASYLLTWPLLFSAPPLAWLILYDPLAPNRWLGMLTFTLSSVVTLLILVPAALLASLMARPDQIGPLAWLIEPQFGVALVMGLLLPQLAVVSGNIDIERGGFVRRWSIPTLAFGLAVYCLIGVLVVAGFSVNVPDLRAWLNW